MKRSTSAESAACYFEAQLNAPTTVKVRPETLERIRAAAATMGISIQRLTEKILSGPLPTVERIHQVAAAMAAEDDGFIGEGNATCED